MDDGAIGSHAVGRLWLVRWSRGVADANANADAVPDVYGDTSRFADHSNGALDNCSNRREYTATDGGRDEFTATDADLGY